MSVFPRRPDEIGLAVPAGVFALLVALTGVYLALAGMPLPGLPAPIDGVQAEALAQAGIDHASGVLLRIAAEKNYRPGVWDALVAAGGILPELGAETWVDSLDGPASAPGRMVYRVRVRDNPAHDSDNTVWITSTGVVYPASGVEADEPQVVHVIEATLRVSHPNSMAGGVVLVARR